MSESTPSADAVVAPRRLTPIGAIGGWLGSIRPGAPTADARAAVDELVPLGPELGEYLLRFAILIALSASIAAFGLLSDSGAVVIGAMLVAPLMTPIMGAAAATVTAQNRKLAVAVTIIALGTVLAIGVGWAMSAVARGAVIDAAELPQEIRSRTFPGILDLGIAITAGLAAGYIQPRRSAISALPGVGIAVALVPPLATVGITLELGLPTEAGNALLLYLTNLAAIVFAAGIMLLASGFRPERSRSASTLHLRLALTGLAVVAVAVPLLRHSRSVFEDTSLRSAVVRSVESWDDEVRIVQNDADVADGVARVELVLVGRGAPEPVWALAELIRERVERPVELEVLYQSNDEFVVTAR